jgi:hypothetical protein
VAVTGLSLTFTGSFFGYSTGLTAAAHEGFESWSEAAGSPHPAFTSSFLSDISLDFPHPHWAGSSSAVFPHAGFSSSAALPHAGYFSSTALPQAYSYLAGGFSFFLGASSTFLSAATTSFYGSLALGFLTSTLSFLGFSVVTAAAALMTSFAGSSGFPQPYKSRAGYYTTLEGAADVLAGAVVVAVAVGAYCFTGALA